MIASQSELPRRSIPLATRIRVLDAAIGSRRPHQLRQAVGEKPEMLLAASQFLLGLAMLVGSQRQERGRPRQGVGEAVKLTNPRRRGGDRLAGQDIPGLPFQFSHPTCERATVKKRQEQAAKDRKGRQKRREKKRARTNSDPACVRGDANSPAPFDWSVRRDHLLSANRIVSDRGLGRSFASRPETPRSLTSLDARIQPEIVRQRRLAGRRIPDSQSGGKFWRCMRSRNFFNGRTIAIS